MISKLSYKTKQFFFVFIKLSIVFGSFYFIYNKLTTSSKLDFDFFVSFLNKKAVFSTKNIVFLLFLSVSNWFFEITKWKILVSFVKKISFYEAFAQSLGSLTASLFTPNRIGEYGAKAIYFKPKYRKRIVLLNFIGNAMQMSATVLFGSIGLFLLTQENTIEINFVRGSRGLLIIMTLFILALLGIRQNNYKIKGFALIKIKRFIGNMPLKIKMTPWCLSLLRYLIFSYQFYFLLSLFNIELFYLEAMMYISSLYLLSSLLPSIVIFDVVVKGSIAVYLFSFINISELTILAVIMLMWLLNVAIPSVFGSLYVLNFNWPQDETK